jgi:hypothetical protein
LLFKRRHPAITFRLNASQSLLVIRVWTIPQGLQPPALVRLGFLQRVDAFHQRLVVAAQSANLLEVLLRCRASAIKALIDGRFKAIKAIAQGADLARYGRHFPSLIEVESHTTTSRRSLTLGVTTGSSSFW